MGIISLTQIKRKGNGSEYIYLFTGVKTGSSILNQQKVKKKITVWKRNKDNIMKINLHIYERHYTLLVVLSPADDQSVASKNKFFVNFGEVMQ